MKILTVAQKSNLLCSAFEGGSNWYFIEKMTPPKTPRSATGEGVIYKHIDYPLTGGSLVIKAQELDDKDYILDAAAIKKGSAVMAEKYPRHYADALTENDDACTGDVFLQCCLFGELVFG
jgi:hypothetical protein